MLKRLARAGAVAALVVAAGAPVMAQSLQIGPGGVQVVPDDRRGPPPRDDRRGPPPPDRRGPPPPDRRGISEREASRIARSEGMREIDDVIRGRRSFRVEGGDRRGRDMTVIIDRYSGDVLDVR